MSGVAALHGYGRRPPMEGLRLFHGVVWALPDFARGAYDELRAGLDEPYLGITADGSRTGGLVGPPAGLSTERLAAAGRRLLAAVERPDQRRQVQQPLDSPHRRWWTNAFPDWMPPGVLLQDAPVAVRDAAMELVAESLSERGQAAVRDAMKLNGLLGEFVDTYVDSLSEWTFFLTIYGDPDPEAPWAWQLMGHHLAINCTVFPDHVVHTPMFLGSEFNDVDGVRLFEAEVAAGTRLMRALDEAQREQATLAPSMRSADLPPELAGPVDGRHVGGAGRDNVVAPYVGIGAGEMDAEARELLRELIEVYLRRLPTPLCEQRVVEVERHLDHTWFCWIGPADGVPPFYYRVHSPVLWIELDHHPGIFLDNDEPEPFHIHTILRTPNGADYGYDRF